MVTMYALCLYHLKTVNVNLPCIFVEHYMPAVLNPFAQQKTGPQIMPKTFLYTIYLCYDKQFRSYLFYLSHKLTV